MANVKVALITGSSSGIGRATAKLFSQKGYNVVVVGSNEQRVNKVVAECLDVSPAKLQPLGLVIDFNNPDEAETCVKKTLDHFGKIDVLVNNAGIFTKTPATEPSSYEIYKQVMTINLDSTVKITLAAVESIKQNKGNIIFVSSVASTKPAESGFSYCASKAAMSIFAKCIAIDLAPDVRVNIVSPGPVLTPIFGRVNLADDQVKAVFNKLTLAGRVGDVDEISSAIAYLASDEASFVNGHEMFIDGGYLIKPSI